MHQVTLEDAQNRLGEIIATSVPGEEIQIVHDNHVVAKLVAVSSAGEPRKPGSAAGSIIYMAPDFDEPLEDFREYME